MRQNHVSTKVGLDNTLNWRQGCLGLRIDGRLDVDLDADLDDSDDAGVGVEWCSVMCGGSSSATGLGDDVGQRVR